MPSRRTCVEPPLWLLWLSDPFNRATHWCVVLIRGEGVGGIRRSDAKAGWGWGADSSKLIQAPRERGREMEGERCPFPHSNLRADSWFSLAPTSFDFYHFFYHIFKLNRLMLPHNNIGKASKKWQTGEAGCISFIYI